MRVGAGVGSGGGDTAACAPEARRVSAGSAAGGDAAFALAAIAGRLWSLSSVGAVIGPGSVGTTACGSVARASAPVAPTTAASMAALARRVALIRIAGSAAARPSRASWNAAADGKRSGSALASARCRISSNHAGTSGTSARTDGTGACRCCIITSYSAPPRNGTRPVSSS